MTVGYNVKIIADSVNPVGDRLTTFECQYPRFVHAELMTHRMFSRNSASSRAIPTQKLMEHVRNYPVMPKWWGKNQSGMQAQEELEGGALNSVRLIWLEGRTQALRLSERLREAGLHKQIANRVLEPWMFITVIVTATEYENWFYLRDSDHAQPEIAWVACEMRKLYNENVPKQMIAGEWHLPYVELQDREHPLFIDVEEWPSSEPIIIEPNNLPMSVGKAYWKFLRKISTARCARVSYLTHDGVRDLNEDLKLHDRLSESGHWSPFEHPAEALETSERSGNFIGFRQYRKFFKNEHRGRKLL